MIFTNLVNAQNMTIQVQGEENSSPLGQVNIFISGKFSTFTNTNGTFSINPEDFPTDSLTILSPNYGRLKVAVGDLKNGTPLILEKLKKLKNTSLSTTTKLNEDTNPVEKNSSVEKPAPQKENVVAKSLTVNEKTQTKEIPIITTTKSDITSDTPQIREEVKTLQGITTTVDPILENSHPQIGLDQEINKSYETFDLLWQDIDQLSSQSIEGLSFIEDSFVFYNPSNFSIEQLNVTTNKVQKIKETQLSKGIVQIVKNFKDNSYFLLSSNTENGLVKISEQEKATQISKHTVPKNSSSVLIRNLLFTVGGIQDNTYSNQFTLYDVVSGKSYKLSPLPQKMSTNLVFSNEYIYAIGGKNNQSKSDKVFRYDIENDIWEQIDTLPVAAHGNQAIVVKSKIIFLGNVGTTSYLSIYDIKKQSFKGYKTNKKTKNNAIGWYNNAFYGFTFTNEKWSISKIDWEEIQE